MGENWIGLGKAVFVVHSMPQLAFKTSPATPQIRRVCQLTDSRYRVDETEDMAGVSTPWDVPQGSVGCWGRSHRRPSSVCHGKPGGGVVGLDCCGAG